MNTEPLKKYIRSMETFKTGKPEESAQLLAESVGASRPTSYMQQNLHKLINPQEPNDAILTIVLHESKRRD